MLDLSGLDTCPPLRCACLAPSGISWTFGADWAFSAIAAPWISGVMAGRSLHCLGPPALWVLEDLCHGHRFRYPMENHREWRWTCELISTKPNMCGGTDGIFRVRTSSRIPNSSPSQVRFNPNEVACDLFSRSCCSWDAYNSRVWFETFNIQAFFCGFFLWKASPSPSKAWMSKVQDCT
jgi:hypothetical protein